MEVTELSLCRLCAQSKSSNEIIGRINNEKLDIESKLIVCCQWNTIDETHSNALPLDVCASCLRRLNQSWSFAEQVRCAQIELHSKLVQKNIALNSELEPKLEHKYDSDDNEDVHSNASLHSNFVGLKVETYSPLRMTEQAEDLDPIDDFNDFDSAAIDADDQFEVGEATNSIANFVVDDIDVKIHQSETKFNEKNFLKSIEKNDRNTDGTIKLEAVRRLGLDDWSIVEYKCYLCKIQLLDQYEWRKHIKIEHPGKPYRHLCNICNDKKYTGRRPLYDHVLSIHRRYFKFCCRNCCTYYWDLNRLQSHWIDCKPEQNKPSLCDICGKEMKTVSLLRLHRKTHFEETRRTFECYLCRKALSRNGLKFHMLAHVTTHRQHKCSFCGKGFAEKRKCNRHVKTHLNVFPFNCSYCDKKFRFRNKLNIHVRTHTGERPYCCILCDYRCSDSGNLCKHMKQKHGMSKTEAIKKLSMDNSGECGKSD